MCRCNNFCKACGVRAFASSPRVEALRRMKGNMHKAGLLYEPTVVLQQGQHTGDAARHEQFCSVSTVQRLQHTSHYESLMYLRTSRAYSVMANRAPEQLLLLFLPGPQHHCCRSWSPWLLDKVMPPICGVTLDFYEPPTSACTKVVQYAQQNRKPRGCCSSRPVIGSS